MIDLGGDVTGDGISKLVFTILSAVAEADRDRVGERIRDVKDDQPAGERFLRGVIPFGYQLPAGGSLVVDEREQKVIKRIEELRGLGGSFREIAKAVGKEVGVKISHMTVRRVLSCTA